MDDNIPNLEAIKGDKMKAQIRMATEAVEQFQAFLATFIDYNDAVSKLMAAKFNALLKEGFTRDEALTILMSTPLTPGGSI